MEAKKHKILVTGALGHIGSALIRNLDKSFIGEVILLDNLETQRYASLFDLPKDFKYQFIQDDITTADFSKHLNGIHAVIHLAALTDAESSVKLSDKANLVNLEGTKRVADACLEAGIRMLYPSTTSVYGSADEVVNETSELKPQSPYAQSKLDAERYIQSLGPKGLKFIICRFGTIFGYSVGMRFHTAVNKFTWQAINGHPITVWKTALNQKRPYLYLGDCIRAVNFVLEKELFDGEIYNVLTNNFTVKNIVDVLQESITDLSVSFVDSAIMNQLSYDVDDSKFRKLGFQPTGDIKAGIKETIFALNGIIKT